MRNIHPIFIIIFFVFSFCSNSSRKNNPEEFSTDFHDQILTIDSHTDTPLRFTRDGFDFGQRQDPLRGGSKVDLIRMEEGKLDGIFLAVFMGQRETTDEGYLKAKMHAYDIFDSIYSVMSRYPEALQLATSPKEFKSNTREGMHSIFIGLENGYPVGMNLDMIDTFYNLGARYITLCHTKNNQICDSSTDLEGPVHNGLSPFGFEVVKRMNDLGMMIDVSHISDKAFYDVLEVTRKPVIASHSCVRAICDNPRNLDDDMLRALAKNNGVIQMCILSDYVQEPVPNPLRDSAKNAVYERHGNYYDLDEEGRQAFLVDWYRVDEIFPPKLADVSKVVDHIDHIVNVAGINHVGIGTDFDGGGGVEGCFDVSEIGNITAELLRRGYSRKDIRKIWAGNLLRVMKDQG
jgi:membrane dipeptidase